MSEMFCDYCGAEADGVCSEMPAAVYCLAGKLREARTENDRLMRFVNFVLKWCDRGAPHGGPGNEATVLNAIRWHPTLSEIRRAALTPTPADTAA